MNIKKALQGAGDFAEAVESGKMRANRDEAMNTEVGNLVIDICLAGDTGKWETGIEKDGEWVIVEQYENRKEATKGHTKWVKRIKESPDCELKDIDLWGLEEESE